MFCQCKSTVTLSYIDPCALYSVIAHAGVMGTWCRVTDMFLSFTGLGEQKIGIAVDPISGKIGVFVSICSNNTHFGGSVHSTYEEPIG
jgi:hypothetical protein